MDAKAAVKIGPFSRGGKSRVPTEACDVQKDWIKWTASFTQAFKSIHTTVVYGGCPFYYVSALDHDFTPNATVTPYGIFLPQVDELFLYFTTSKVTSDFIADTIES